MVKMINKIKQLYREKRRSLKSGFSVLEMLVAILILLLASQLVAEAMALAGRHYIESTNRSKAQMIVSTLADFIRGELLTASDIVVDGDEVSFIDGSGRLGGRCVIKYDDKTVYLERKNKKAGDKNNVYYPIIGSSGSSQTEYAEGLYVSSFELDSKELDDKEIEFEYKIVVSDKKGKELASGKYSVKGKTAEED